MEVDEWLNRNQIGYRELTPEDKSAIGSFTMVWTVFEAQALNTHGNASEICRYVDTHMGAFDDLTEFNHSLAYFRNRYIEDDVTNNNFIDLNFKRNDPQELVKEVLIGLETRPQEVVKALLVIVLRLRHNFFHGLKWEHHMQDQRANFEHATSILMFSLDRGRDVL